MPAVAASTLESDTGHTQGFVDMATPDNGCGKHAPSLVTASALALSFFSVPFRETNIEGTFVTGEVPARTPPPVPNANVMGSLFMPDRSTSPEAAVDNEPIRNPSPSFINPNPSSSSTSSSSSFSSATFHVTVPASTRKTPPAEIRDNREGCGFISTVQFGTFDPSMMHAQHPTAVQAVVVACKEEEPPMHSQTASHLNPQAKPSAALISKAPAKVSLPCPTVAAAPHDSGMVSGSSGSGIQAAAEAAAADALAAQGLDEYYDVAPKSPCRVRKVVAATVKDVDNDIPTAVPSPTAQARISTTAQDVASSSLASTTRSTTARPPTTALPIPSLASSSTTPATTTTRPNANPTPTPRKTPPAPGTAHPARRDPPQDPAAIASVVRKGNSGGAGVPALSLAHVESMAVASQAATSSARQPRAESMQETLVSIDQAWIVYRVL